MAAAYDVVQDVSVGASAVRRSQHPRLGAEGATEVDLDGAHLRLDEPGITRREAGVRGGVVLDRSPLRNALEAGSY